jgi:CheY-like chemotaxis protein
LEAKEARSLRILIIEDNKDLAMLICSIFELLGHKAVSANSGIEGIKKAQEDRPNAIFCDIGLPDMNGYEVAKQIRSEELLNDVFLIALTGYAGQNDIERAKESGFSLYLSKPIDIDVIRKVLNQIPLN